MTLENVLIIGGGQAGAQLAISLRDFGFRGMVTLIGDEKMLPYQRPPLSKAYMAGKVAEAGLQMRNADYYQNQSIEVVSDVRVVEVRPSKKLAIAECGRCFRYDHLVLATGTRNRLLPLDNAHAPNVRYLRTVEDAGFLRKKLAQISNAVVIGAGFIGLEFAAVAAKQGVDVTVVEIADRVMARAVSPEISRHFEAAHRNAGVKLMLTESVSHFEMRDGEVAAVHTSKGVRIPADVVLVGIGVLPNVELALSAGLDVKNGIVVDQFLMTSDRNISAIGDCAAFPSAHLAGYARLESVQNAVDHAKTLARRLCGHAGPFDAVPWFWSDQGADKLQIAGLSRDGEERLVIGCEAEARFSVLRFRDGLLSCVESVNRVADHLAARKLLQAGVPVTIDAARASGFDLKSFASELDLNVGVAPQAIA